MTLRFALLLLATFLAACSAAEASINRVYFPITARDPSPTPTPRTTIVGQMLDTLGGFSGQPLRVTVTSAQTRPSIPYYGSQINAAGQFLVVLATVSNGGTRSDAVTSSLWVSDSVGRQFDVVTSSAALAARTEYGRAMPYESIQPGTAVASVFVFDVAVNATGFALVGAPASTPTQTATPTVTPTATPLPATLTVASQSTRQTGTYHYVYFDLRNDGPGVAYFPSVQVTYYGVSNTVMGASTRYGRRSMLKPGESTSGYAFAEPQSGWARYEIIPAYSSVPQSREYVHDGLTLNGTSRFRSGSTLHVTGMLRNDTGTALCWAEIEVAVFQSDGIIGESDSGYPFGSTNVVQAGASGSFDISMLDYDNRLGAAPVYSLRPEGARTAAGGGTIPGLNC